MNCCVFHYRRLQMIASVVCFVLIATLGSVALALDSNQEGALNQANAALKSAESDLASARSSAGTASNPATGSRLRLTQMRLSSASQRIDHANTALSNLPAGDDAVKQTIARRDAAAALAAQLNAIINPDSSGDKASSSDAGDKKESSDASGDSKPAKAAEPEKKAPRLHYQDEDKLKDARFHLRDAQGKGKASGKVIAAIDDEKTTVVYRQVIEAANTLNAAQEKLNLSYKTLEPLPAEHPSIVAAMKEVRETNDQFGAMRERLKAEYLKLDKLANLKYYPDYDKDYALLRELSGRYRDFTQSAAQPEQLIQVINEDGQAIKEIQRIAKTYLPLVEQKTEAGENMEKQFNYFMSQRQKFNTEMGEYRKQLPASFDADIAQAMAYANQGVKEEKPMYFGPTSGIEQQLGFAQTKLSVIEAFGKEAAAPYREKLAKTRADVKEMAKSLSQQIINSNTLPPDVYKGDDREKIIAVAKDAWSHQQKDANVLKACIVSENWKRTTKWEWFAGSFEKVDYSRLQVQLIIKRDDKTAAVQAINMRMDHLEGDKLTGHPMRSGDEEVQPHSIMLLEKVK